MSKAKMKAIVEVKIIEVDRDALEIAHYNRVPYFDLATMHEPIEENIQSELIEGRRYRLPDGEMVLIGVSEQALNALHIPVAGYRDSVREIESLMRVNRELRLRLLRAGQASLWDRILFVFGILPPGIGDR